MASVQPATAAYVQNLLERAAQIDLVKEDRFGVDMEHVCRGARMLVRKVISGRQAAEEAAHQYVSGLMRKALAASILPITERTLCFLARPLLRRPSTAPMSCLCFRYL